MKDEEFRKKRKAVKRVIQDLQDDDPLSKADGETLLAEGRELIEDAQQVLESGSGRTVLVREDNADVETEPLPVDNEP